MRAIHPLFALGVAWALNGCSSDGATENGNGLTPDGNSGVGTLVGTVGEFGSVADARWIGAPDDPANTRVIYLFDEVVNCTWLSQEPRWSELRLDGPIPNGVRVIEIKFFGTGPGEYALQSGFAPVAGDVAISYLLVSNQGRQGWPLGTAGLATLAQVVDGESAEGTFDVTSRSDSSDEPLSGTFHATYCATGREAAF